MKNQSGSLDFGIEGKIYVYMCFMCYALALFIFYVLEFVCRKFLYGVKTYRILVHSSELANLTS